MKENRLYKYEVKTHELVLIGENSKINFGTKLYTNIRICNNVSIGEYCKIGANVFIGNNVEIGDRCKIQGNVFIPEGVFIEDDVFIGPSVTFTNVKYPRADYPAEEYEKTYVRNGASIGANSTILPGITLGIRCVVGAGSVVTKNIDDYSAVCGNPAKIFGIACVCGGVMKYKGKRSIEILQNCPKCSK